MDIVLTYGSESRSFSISDEKLAVLPIAPRESAAQAGDPREALRAALGRPIGRPRLRDMVRNRRVALVVNDEFRAGLHEAILDVMFEEIVAGKPSKLTVLCATGTHDPSIYTSNVQEWTRRFSEKHHLAYDFVGHDCDDPQLIEVGVTSRGNRVSVEAAWLEADVRVFGHEGKHHYMAGYSTVAKQVLPGIADRASVTFNHKLALDDASCAGQHPLHRDPSCRTNPFSEDAQEAFHIAMGSAESFLLEVISDKAHVFWTAAGDPDEVTRRMINEADKQSLFTVPRSRYVIVSPGGPPASTSLYGVQNCFDLALLGAIKSGGEALVVAPCDGRPGVSPEVCGLAPDVKSKKLFWDNLVIFRDATLQECRDTIANNFELYLWKTWRVLRLFKREKVKIWMYSQLPAEKLAEAGFECASDIQEWVDERINRNDGMFTVVDGGNKLLIRGA